MDVAVLSTKAYDRRFLSAASGAGAHALTFLEPRLSPETVALVPAGSAVCAFVNDDLGAPVIEQLAAKDVRLVALRCAGFNNVDLAAAARHGMTIGRVPAYSPHAVAEHSVALMLSLNRKIHRAYNRVREGNFALEGLLGFDMAGKTVGIVGTGGIGAVMARILAGFSCQLLGCDPVPNPECETLVRYVSFEELISLADIVTLHCPLTPATHHLIDEQAVAGMKPGVMLINTSRGAVIDTRATIGGLKSGHIGGLGLDVYEEEADLFFEDLSERAIGDDMFARLLTFPNVLITGHQGFFTTEAMTAIAQTTIANINAFESTGRVLHEVSIERSVNRA